MRWCLALSLCACGVSTLEVDEPEHPVFALARDARTSDVFLVEPVDAGDSSEHADAGQAAPIDRGALSVTAPSSLICLSSGTISLRLDNTGTTTWAQASGHHVIVTGGAPLSLAARLELASPVPPGASFTMSLPFRSPAIPAAWDVEFQLARTSPFGAPARHRVSSTIGCTVSSACSFPQGVPEQDFTWHANTSASVAATVNQVMSQLSGCPVNSDCPLTPRFPDDQAWFTAVTAALRARGLCAGQHELGHTDEIAVSDTGCSGRWFGYHVFNYGGSKVVWATGAARGSWSIEPSHCPAG